MQNSRDKSQEFPAFPPIPSANSVFNRFSSVLKDENSPENLKKHQKFFGPKIHVLF